MIRNYVEVDFMEVTTKKAMCIKKSRELLQVLGDPHEIKLGEIIASLTLVF